VRCALLSYERVPVTMPPVEPAMHFAANLRRLRAERGQSQEDFADDAKLHRTEVTKLESGRRDPKLATIVKVARGLEVPLAELLVGIDDDSQPPPE
jgi:transcriptional regulator with XRE-family HTH domain